MSDREKMQIKFGNPAKTYRLAENQIYESTKLFYTNTSPGQKDQECYLAVAYGMDVLVMTFGYGNQYEQVWDDNQKAKVNGDRQTLERVGYTAQKRLEWLNRDFRQYVRHKKTRAEEGSGE